MNKHSLEKKNAILIIIFLYAKYLSSCCSLFYLDEYTNQMAIVLSLVIFVYMFICNDFKMTRKAILILLFVVMLYLLNMVFSDEKIYVLSMLVDFLAYNVIFLYLLNQKIDYQYLLQFWSKVAVVTTFITMLASLLGSLNSVNYMYIGIYMSLNYIIIFYQTLQNGIKSRYAVMLICAFLLILLKANKGALVTVWIGTVLLYYNSVKNRNKKTIFILGTILSLPLIYVNLISIFEFIQNIIERLNMNAIAINRWIYTLKIGFEGGSAGRDVLYSEAITLIKDLCGLPGGVAAYYIYTGHEYPHNIILEVMIVLGTVLGTLGIVIFIIKSISYYKNVKNCDYCKAIFFIMMWSFFVGRTLFSSTFLKERGFWIVTFMILFTKSSVNQVKNIECNEL